MQVQFLSEERFGQVPGVNELLGYRLNLRRGIKSAYKHCREDRLLGFLKEYEWRYVHRRLSSDSFTALTSRFPDMPQGIEDLFSR